MSKTGKGYGGKFQLESIEKLSEIIEKDIRKQESLLEKTKKLKEFYPAQKDTSKVLVSHFDSVEAIELAIFFTLQAKSKLIRTIVPSVNFFHENKSGFVEEYVKEKNKRNIKTKAVWEDIPKKIILKEYYNDSKVKQLPIDMHNSFKTTVFIYDDKTLYIGPIKESYAVLIQSKEHAQMMVSIFENMWTNSIEIA